MNSLTDLSLSLLQKASAPTTTMDPVEYRKALSCFATGVAVITSRWQDSDWGMTCNSFASVSLEPPLVLWSIRKAARSLEAFTQSTGFLVSVLTEAQAPLARQFATGDMGSRFDSVPVHREESGRLRLSQSMAWFNCDLHQLVDAGDHLIVLGRVTNFGWQESSALTFWRSQMGTFNPLA